MFVVGSCCAEYNRQEKMKQTKLDEGRLYEQILIKHKLVYPSVVKRDKFDHRVQFENQNKRTGSDEFCIYDDV